MIPYWCWILLSAAAGGLIAITLEEIEKSRAEKRQERDAAFWRDRYYELIRDRDRERQAFHKLLREQTAEDEKDEADWWKK